MNEDIFDYGNEMSNPLVRDSITPANDINGVEAISEHILDREINALDNEIASKLQDIAGHEAYVERMQGKTLTAESRLEVDNKSVEIVGLQAQISHLTNERDQLLLIKAGTPNEMVTRTSTSEGSTLFETRSVSDSSSRQDMSEFMDELKAIGIEPMRFEVDSEHFESILETESVLGNAISEQDMTELMDELKAVGIEPMQFDTQLETKDTQDIESIQAWLGDINPNYNPFDYTCPYNVNCGSCSLAVWNRLNGGDLNMVAGAENIPYNHQMEALTGMQQVEMTPSAIKDYLFEQGAGANGIVGIDRADGAGHWLNVYNDGERVVAIDGQDGSVKDWPPTDLGNVVRWELSIRKGE